MPVLQATSIFPDDISTHVDLLDTHSQNDDIAFSYKRYSYKGSAAYRRRKGEAVGNGLSDRNLFDYLRSAKRKMGDDFIDTLTPRHMAYIRRCIEGKPGRNQKRKSLPLKGKAEDITDAVDWRRYLFIPL